MIPLQYDIFEYILPLPDRFISNTKVAHIWHTSGTQLTQTSTHLAQTGTQLAHLTALATEAVSTGANARVGTHTN